MRASMTPLLSVLSLLPCLAQAAVPQGLHARATTCNRDNCYRNVFGTNNAGRSAQGSKDCTSYLQRTVTPCDVTQTSTIVTTPTTTTTTTSVEIDTATTTVVVTTTVTANAKRGVLEARTTSTCPVISSAASTAIPVYASACTGNRFSSVCSCNGNVPTTTTVVASTVTTTVTSTAPSVTSTGTATSTSTSTITATSTATVTAAYTPPCTNAVSGTGGTNYCQFYSSFGMSSNNFQGTTPFATGTSGVAASAQACADAAAAAGAQSFQVYYSNAQSGWLCNVGTATNCGAVYTSNTDIETIRQYERSDVSCN